MSGICSWSTLEREEHKKRIEDLWQTWKSRDKYKKIYNLHGDGEHSEIMFKEWGHHILEKPIHNDFLITKADVRRLQLEMKQYNNKLSGKFVKNWLQDMFFVPEAISRRDPLARKFYKSLHNSLNYERVNLSKGMGLAKIVSGYLREAHISSAGQSRLRLGIKTIDRIRDLQKKMQTTDDELIKAEFTKELTRIVEGDEGKVLRHFTELMEMDKNSFDLIPKKKMERFTELGAESEFYNENTYRAAEAGRKLTKEMGLVFNSGLDQFAKAAMWKYLGTDKPEIVSANKEYNRVVKAIDEAKSRLEIGMKDGGYLAKYAMNDQVQVLDKINSFMEVKEGNRGELKEKLSQLEEVLGTVNKATLDDRLKPVHPDVQYTWDRDPLRALHNYAADAVGFNKLTRTMRSYLYTMKHLTDAKGRDPNEGEWITGMRKWIDEEFTIANRGLQDRPGWVNSTVRTIMAAEVVRTMGLNFTGSIVNASGVLFGAAHLGFKTILRGKRLYRDDVEIRRMVDKAEDEAGFLFNDVSSELVSEGILPKEGVNVIKPQWNPEKGRFETEGQNLKDYFKAAGNWTVEKSLIFHRITENWSRRFLYRNALIEKYMQAKDNPEYFASVGKDVITRQSKDWALEFVNRYAYEYAIHAKPKVARGVPGQVDEVGNKIVTGKMLAGAVGQVSTQLLHYPMSLLDTQVRNAKGGWNAVRVGQWDAPELMYLYRYFGLFSAITLGSIATNLNLFGMMPNETIEMANDVQESIEGALDPKYETKTFGLVSKVIGPFPSHVIFGLRYGIYLSGIRDSEPGFVEKLLLGNLDFSTEEDRKYNAYQLSTEYGKWKTKTQPALQDGRGWDVVRHYFRAYPGKLPIPGPWPLKTNSKEIKEKRAKFFGKKIKAKKRKGSVQIENTAAIQILNNMLSK